LNLEVARSDKLKALIGAIALTIAIAVLVPPAVEAAAQKVKTVKGSVTKVQGAVTAKMRSTSGKVINSKRITSQGLFDAAGSAGALDVRTFAGGNGFIGAGNCPAGGLTNTAVVPGGSIVTGIIATSAASGVITVTSDAIGGGALPLLQFQVNADSPNVGFSLGNGIRATDTITFTCTGTARFVLIGQDD